MANKIIPLVLIAVVVGLGLGLGIYWYSQKTAEVAMPSDVQDLEVETEGISQDIADLEEMDKAAGLENLAQDLSVVSGEEGLVDVSSVSDLETEISMDLNGLSNDISDLSALESDTSLNELDTSLSGVAQ